MPDQRKVIPLAQGAEADAELPRVAELRSEVQRLLLERARLTKGPEAAVSLAAEGVTVHTSVRPDTPQETVSAIADVLARAMDRLRKE